MATIVETIFKQTRPAQIRRYRDKYNDYKLKTEDEEGEPAKDFRSWLKEQGVNPDELLGSGT